MKYNIGLRITFFESQLGKVPQGHHITHIFMAYIKHLISNQSAAFTIQFGNNTSGTTKEAIIKAVSHKQQIGKVLTLSQRIPDNFME
jgi:hypothetical protein